MHWTFSVLSISLAGSRHRAECIISVSVDTHNAFRELNPLFTGVPALPRGPATKSQGNATNDRRMNHSTQVNQHAALLSQTPAPDVRPPTRNAAKTRRPRTAAPDSDSGSLFAAAAPTASASATSALASVEPGSVDVLVGLMPFMSPNLPRCEADNMAPPFAFDTTDLGELQRRLEEVGLIIPVTLPVHGSVWETMDDQIRAHCEKHSFVLPPRPRHPNARGRGQPPRYADSLPWMVMGMTKPSKNEGMRRLLPTQHHDSPQDFTYKGLFTYNKTSYTKVSSQLATSAIDRFLFVGPRFGNVRGPISFAVMDHRLFTEPNFTHMAAPHRCFPTHVLETVFPDLSPQCLPDCVRDADRGELASPSLPPPMPIDLPSPAMSDDDLPERLTAQAPRLDAASSPPPAVVPARRPRPVSANAADEFLSASTSMSDRNVRARPSNTAADSLYSAETLATLRCLRATYVNVDDARPRHAAVQGLSGSASTTTSDHNVRAQPSNAAADSLYSDETLATLRSLRATYVDHDEGSRTGASNAIPSSAPSGSVVAPQHTDVIDLTGGEEEQEQKAVITGGVTPVMQGLAAAAALPPLLSRLSEPEPYTTSGVAAMSLRVMRWANHAREVLRGSAADPPFLLQAPTVDAGARALNDFIAWHVTAPVERTSSSFHAMLSAVHHDVRMSDVPLQRIFSATSHWEIGDGFGPGPRMAVLRQAVLLCTHRVNFWRKSHDSFVPDLYPSDQIIPERQRAFRLFGVLSFIYMVLTEIGPDPISPFFFQYIVDGRSAFTIDAAFISELHPPSLTVLTPWTMWRETPSYPISTTSTLGTLLAEAGISVGLFAEGMDDRTRAGLETSLLCYVLFGQLDPSHHPDFIAFAAGFNQMGGMEGTLGTAKPVLVHMFNRRVRRPEQVTQLLTFKSAYTQEDKENPPTEVIRQDLEYEDQFKDCLIAFLKGSGLPQHSFMDDFFEQQGQHLRVIPGDPATIRARCFLQAMTGADLLPRGYVENSKPLKIKFSHNRDHATKHTDEPKPIHWGSCFNDAAVCITAPLRNLLDEEVVAGQATYFDVWMYQPLMLLQKPEMDSFEGERYV
ncbi:hypothetical protein FA95DRAFT_1564265 [Auriscalpium vulgare]|uniref:Uncharacterized protein n=1 Tax=Auriscalpium vulgare TaxID=40419 RepID=A0ACB8RFX4_9AGAM|nr:hypothetical protein FA95DRAFT_1564265 [Auriscalpium vulgare]